MEIHGIRAFLCIFPVVFQLAQVTGTLGFREGTGGEGRTRFAALFFGFSPFVISSIYLRAEQRELGMIHQLHVHILPCSERKSSIKRTENYGGGEEPRLGLQEPLLHPPSPTPSSLTDPWDTLRLQTQGIPAALPLGSAGTAPRCG